MSVLNPPISRPFATGYNARMALLSDRCICLRRFQYSETSQILTLFSRQHGIVRVIAKGAHRRTKVGASKFDGGIDLLDLGDGIMTNPADKDLATLTEWKLVEGHLNLRKALRPLYLSLYAAELTGLLLHEQEPQPRVFDLLSWLLEQLPGERREESLVAYELDLLRYAGFLPELSRCIVCSGDLPADGRLSFSPGAGGVVCPTCTAPPGIRLLVEARLLRMITMVLRLPRVDGIPQKLPRLTRIQTNPVNRLLADHIRHLLGHDLRLASYVL